MMESAKECIQNITQKSAHEIFGAYIAKTETPSEGEPPWFHVRCKFQGKKKSGYFSLVLPRSESKRMIGQLAKDLDISEKEYDSFVVSCMDEYVNTIAGSVVVNEEIMEHFGQIHFTSPALIQEDLPEPSQNELFSLSFKTDNGSPILVSISLDA